MRLYVVPRNEQVPVTRWNAWAGYSTQKAGLHFNQEDPAQFDSSISYIVGKARELKRMNPQVQPQFSLPFPGTGQMEAIVAGTHDAVYRRAFEQMLAVFDVNSTGRIDVRIGWEQNFEPGFQKNSATNLAGVFDPPLYVEAYRHIVAVGRSVSPRFLYNWCPNHGLGSQTRPLSNYYPGDDVVDEIGFDFYMQARWGNPSFDWIVNSPYGAAWFRDFARVHGKPWCIPELGADNDAAAPILDQFMAWCAANGCVWIGWYDRSEVINSEISTGALPAVGAVVKKYAR